ncbi:MmyB family transcriptional regulator [Vibrio viridaestus]|uniref:XRE family transcriptional regulator n=1 Tax=Vibrio viridaestus TaxID=2487322 RepID=A0A3N9TKY9_9VIBR|nr:helix-turn-helix domain-containing protein [Vibrio viridaestus]RQW64644.1 XRE family transcriptional regulator [Vibrio viridaestus]
MQNENLKLLGDFLRIKREQVQPESIGLSKPFRSRAKGLRREDVAYKAGISTVWYSQIERGQALGISMQVLTAISDTLLLSPSEYKYICNLVHSLPDEQPVVQSATITSKTSQLLFQLNPLPALLQNEYLDIIGSNKAFDLMVGFSLMEIEPENRNYLYLIISNTDWNKFLNIDSKSKLERQIYRIAGFLRNALAANPNDEKLKLKIEAFTTLSPIFALAWQHNVVLQPEEILYTYNHASIGDVTLDKQIWWNIDGKSNSRLNIYYPSNGVDEQHLAELFDA